MPSKPSSQRLGKPPSPDFSPSVTAPLPRMSAPVQMTPAMSNHAGFPISDHCNGHRFFNPSGPTLPRLRDVLRWKLTSRAKSWPNNLGLTPSSRRPLSSDETRATWINHSTFLIETPQGNFLTDPVFSSHCGPAGKIGPRRVHPPGIALQDLPPIHYVLLSHDHYDHCDLPSLRMLAQLHDPIAFTPLGNGDLLQSAGIVRVHELDWWQNQSLSPNLALSVTPALHWSNRLGVGRGSRLWGGFYVTAGNLRFFFAGDTRYDRGLFSEIAKRLGPPDFAMLPIGAYEPRWFMRGQHCDPEEALQIHRDLVAKTSLAMHWGTFQLADEGRDDPPDALRKEIARSPLENKDFRILAPGENAVFLPQEAALAS